MIIQNILKNILTSFAMKKISFVVALAFGLNSNPTLAAQNNFQKKAFMTSSNSYGDGLKNSVKVRSINAKSTATQKISKIILVNSHQKPIVNAEVVVGLSSKESYSTKTNANGRILLKTLNSSNPTTLRISHNNHMYTVLRNIDLSSDVATRHTIPYKNDITFESSGKSVGFQGVRRDGKIDFGITIKGFSQKELLNVNATDFISATLEPVPTFSRMKVPTNVTLPKQQERYFIRINLDKESFKKNFEDHNEPLPITTLHGQFPLSKAINIIQDGKSFLALAKIFNFKSYDIKIVDNKKPKNIVFDLSSKKIDDSFTIRPTNTDALSSILALSFGQVNDYHFVPFDIKLIEGKTQTSLEIPQTIEQPYALLVMTERTFDDESRAFLNTLNQWLEQMLTDPSEEELHDLNNIEDIEVMLSSSSAFLETGNASIVFTPTSKDKATTPTLLPLLKNVTLENETLSFTLPELPQELHPQETKVRFLEIETKNIGKNIPILYKKPLIEVGQSGWENTINLSFLKPTQEEGKKYAWEILLIARDKSSSTATHSTRYLHKINNAE